VLREKSGPLKGDRKPMRLTFVVNKS